MNPPIDDPAVLRQLPERELTQVADQLRQEILTTVSRNGGHLASNLGTVELTVALHRVFDTPREKIFFDVGHQSYAHKLLTGRREKFDRLRQADGPSGFANPAESPYDPAVSGHAGVALSEAMGCAAAAPNAPEKIIAVVGDGAIGNGTTFEALNQVANCPGRRRLLLVLNDNRMSISENVGTLSNLFNQLIAAGPYNSLRRKVKRLLKPVPPLKGLFTKLNDAGKSVILPPSALFETFSFRYFGPVDGHDLGRLIATLRRLRALEGPLLLHVVTEKGHGVDFASAAPTRYHGISSCDPESGEMKSSGGGFSAAFGAALEKLAEEIDDLIAVCPAMLEGTGLSGFAKKFPKRCFDVGIAEGHAVTFAAGLAVGGKRPVCAFYDTFLQRALDHVYHDIVLNRLPVVIAADRAGAVPDGPTHHGIYSPGFLRTLPYLSIVCPSCESEMEAALRFAVDLASPVILRYPRGGSARQFEAIPFALGRAVIRREGTDDAPVIWSCGAEVATACQCAELLAEEGLDCTVADARFLKPFDRELARSFADRPQFVIEDNCVSGGLASALREALDGIAHRAITAFGWSDEEPTPHGEVAKLRDNAGLRPDRIAREIADICKKF